MRAELAPKWVEEGKSGKALEQPLALDGLDKIPTALRARRQGRLLRHGWRTGGRSRVSRIAVRACEAVWLLASSRGRNG